METIKMKTINMKTINKEHFKLVMKAISKSINRSSDPKDSLEHFCEDIPLNINCNFCPCKKECLGHFISCEVMLYGYLINEQVESEDKE